MRGAQATRNLCLRDKVEAGRLLAVWHVSLSSRVVFDAPRLCVGSLAVALRCVMVLTHPDMRNIEESCEVCGGADDIDFAMAEVDDR